MKLKAKLKPSIFLHKTVGLIFYDPHLSSPPFWESYLWLHVDNISYLPLHERCRECHRERLNWMEAGCLGIFHPRTRALASANRRFFQIIGTGARESSTFISCNLLYLPTRSWCM